MPPESLTTTPSAISPAALGGHGHDNRGFEAGAIPGMGYGRFGRMFPFSGRPLSDDCLKAIAHAMIKDDVSTAIDADEPIDENPATPSGYTYFGQFIDHDLTLDPSPLSVDRIDVAAMEDFRTPALDLDCLYGRGPDDQPYMYHADGLRLREGAPLTSGRARPTRDLPRIGPSEPGEGQRAIIGDKRNDENRIVASFHAIMIALHNKVVMSRPLIEQFGGDFADPVSRFRAAVNIVRWHYQWLVVNDYLDRHILKPGTIAGMMTGGIPVFRFYDKADARFAYIPVEFAGAAFRFGHSMVRPGYAVNSDITVALPEQLPPGTDRDARIPIFSAGKDPRNNLNGFGQPMPANWGIDWAFYFDMPKTHLTTAQRASFKIPQPSYRLDALLVGPLQSLPEFAKETVPVFKNLAYRNLRRGSNVLNLPSGEQVAHALGLTPLTTAQLWQSFGTGVANPTPLDPADENFVTSLVNLRSAVWTGFQTQLNGNTPLWYYILREAELFGTQRVASDPMLGFGGQHLGPVGSVILAETFLGLLWRDEKSYLRRWPLFDPVFPKKGATFTVGDLVAFALG